MVNGCATRYTGGRAGRGPTVTLPPASFGERVLGTTPAYSVPDAEAAT